MNKGFTRWIRVNYSRITSSIAFYPVLIALAFLGGALLMIMLDFSEAGKELKSQITWVRLKDASTARTIISTIAAGILSLTVFSFSMVMIVLNQAASQMSNRVLDNLIGNRFQQIVLGIYIGTIVYALFLLSTIRDIDAGIYIPALSTYLLIAFTVIDIFIFIYFLHYITSSVKYETIIHRISEQSLTSMKKTCTLTTDPDETKHPPVNDTLLTATTAIFQGFDQPALMKLCTEKNISIRFLYITGTFILEGAPYAVASHSLTDEVKEEINVLVNFHRGDEIDTTYYYGFRQLVEVAVKALSPGVNDPGTAIESVRALAHLLVYRHKYFPQGVFKDDKGNVRVITKEKTFDELFNDVMLPIWDYGSKDRLLRHELLLILRQFEHQGVHPSIALLVQKVNAEEKAL